MLLSTHSACPWSRKQMCSQLWNSLIPQTKLSPAIELQCGEFSFASLAPGEARQQGLQRVVHNKPFSEQLYKRWELCTEWKTLCCQDYSVWHLAANLQPEWEPNAKPERTLDEKNYRIKEFRNISKQQWRSREPVLSLSYISTLSVPDKAVGITGNSVVVSTRPPSVPGVQAILIKSCLLNDLWLVAMLKQRKRSF